MKWFFRAAFAGDIHEKRFPTGWGCCGGVAFEQSAFAGDRDREQDPMHGPRREQMMDELELNDTQRTQMTDIFKRHHDKMIVLREDTEAEVDKILTPEQRKKLDKMKAKRQEKWQEKKEKWKEKHGKDAQED